MVLARFLPQDERFFEFFRRASNNARDAATLLAEVLSTTDDTERKVRRMRDLEHQGDEITHQIFNALNSTFVTPLDRDDIRELAARMDDFVDCIEDVARRLQLYHLDERPAAAKALARIISDQAEHINRALPLLRDLRQRDELLHHSVEINRLEDEADDTFNQALASLYDGAADIPTLVHSIRWGELYELLEDATDRAEDVANALEGIVLKHG